MTVDKQYLQALLTELTLMEGQLCELLSQVCRQRERFRAVLDEWEDEQQARRDTLYGSI